jgi:hypothetical protein
MGVCNTEDDQENRRKMFLNDTDSSNHYNKQKTENFECNNNIEISLNSKKTIIKTIGQIKGEPISIKNNLNCIILIMDYSFSITIQNCQNCSIFVAPCKTLVDVRDCNNLNLISASLNLKITNVKESNFYSFVSHSPIIESSEAITLGNFFVQYMELQEMFSNSELNIWSNKWSDYKEIGNNVNINYSNDNIKQNIIDIFMPIFPKCYINIDQFQFVPFVYGKSVKTENYINFLIILRQEDLQESEILKMLIPEELENYRVKLISTFIVNDKSNIIQDVIKKLEGNDDNKLLIDYLMRKKNEGLQSLKSSRQRTLKDNPSINSSNKSRSNEYDLCSNGYFANNNNKFLQKGDFLFLWFINEDNYFEDIDGYFNFYLEPLIVCRIIKENFNYEDKIFKQYLQKIFGFSK